jgi:hypothetical protein
MRQYAVEEERSGRETDLVAPALSNPVNNSSLAMISSSSESLNRLVFLPVDDDDPVVVLTPVGSRILNEVEFDIFRRCRWWSKWSTSSIQLICVFTLLMSDTLLVSLRLFTQTPDEVRRSGTNARNEERDKVRS